MESQPNTPRDEKCSSAIAETIAFCGLVSLIWLLIAMCAWTTYNGYPPKGFVTGQSVILSHDRDTKGDPHPDRAKHMYQPGDAGQITYCEPDV